MRFSPYSFSRMSSYETCPKKFQFSYIDKIPVNRSTTALDKGSYIHHCLELHPAKPSQFYNIDKELLDEYDVIIKNFLNSEVGSIVLSELNIGKEIDFGLTKDFKICSFDDADAILRGSVDRLNQVGNVLHVVDYKSGKAKDLKWQSYKQVMLYAIWIFRNPIFDSVNEVLGSYVYVEHNVVNEKRFYRTELLDYINEYVKTIKTIENTEVFAKKETRLCDWCEYKEHCDKLNLIF